MFQSQGLRAVQLCHAAAGAEPPMQKVYLISHMMGRKRKDPSIHLASTQVLWMSQREQARLALIAKT
jgi:hypothetical protein